MHEILSLIFEPFQGLRNPKDGFGFYLSALYTAVWVTILAVALLGLAMALGYV